MKKVICLVLSVIMMLSFSACFDGIDGDEAKATVNEFFDAIEQKDYNAAEDLLHPERPADLKTFFEGFEKYEGLDFSEIEIKKYTKVGYTHYDLSVDGGSCTLTMDVSVSGKLIVVVIEVVENESGYGIYNLDITP